MIPRVGERVTVVEVTFWRSRPLRGIVDGLYEPDGGFYVDFRRTAIYSVYPDQKNLPPADFVFGLEPYGEGVGWCHGWEGEEVEAMMVARGLG